MFFDGFVRVMFWISLGTIAGEIIGYFAVFEKSFRNYCFEHLVWLMYLATETSFLYFSKGGTSVSFEYEVYFSTVLLVLFDFIYLGYFVAAIIDIMKEKLFGSL